MPRLREWESRTTHPHSETKSPVDADAELTQIAHEIEEISAEGRPADPETTPRRIGLWIAGCFAALILVGTLIAVVADVAFGLTVAIVALIIFAFNPELWANIKRASERRIAKDEVRRHSQNSAPDHHRVGHGSPKA